MIQTSQLRTPRYSFSGQSPFVLTTDRLKLLPVKPTMRAELHHLFTNADVRRYLMDDQIVGIDWIDDVIDASQRQFEETGYGLWALRQRDRIPLIGFCGYWLFDQLQLAYGLLPAYWGRGLATEAAQAAIDHGFRHVGFSEIVAAADAPNTASFGVMERLGMLPWKSAQGMTYYRLFNPWNEK